VTLHAKTHAGEAPMFDATVRMVALRYLGARREEGFVSVIAAFSLIGIALGVAVLIVVMSVMNGFQVDLLGRILGLNGHLSITSLGGGNLQGFDALARKFASVDGVARVTPIVEGQGLISANGRSSAVIVRGIRRDDLAARTIVSESLARGSLDGFAGKSTVIVGSRLAERLGLKPGDRMRLISPQLEQNAFGSVPRMKTYRVVATFEVGMYEYDNGFIFMPLDAAQLFFRTGRDAVTNLEVMARNPAQAGSLAPALVSAADAPIRVFDWQRQNESFFYTVQVQRNVLFLILALIILIAALNIISGLIMLVKDKGRDVAILRTMGANRATVLKIFFLAGSAIGIVGSATGLVLGVLFADNIGAIQGWVEAVAGIRVFDPQIYYLSTLPSRIETWDVVSVLALSLGLSFLATLYPAWRAARLDPVEALCYE
jgi:lipoprotein-releasing system permease protein